MPLAKATKEHIATVADSAAVLQLASELAANRLTGPVLDRATETLVARVAIEGLSSKEAAWLSVARNVRDLEDQVQLQFRAAMLEARAIGREFAMQQVALEAKPLVQTAAHALLLTPTLPAAEVEAMWAHHAATGMARQFGAAAIAEVSRWKAANESTTRLPAKLRRVREAVEPERKRHYVTQSVGAFNEAKREKWVELKDRAKALPGMPSVPVTTGRGSGRGRPVDDGARELWSAVLDTKTCPVCWKLDGNMVKVGEPFHEGARTPLHGHCRCTVITIFIPAEIQRYLDGAGDDYESLKADIKDYMGSRKFDVGEGVRHAKRFVDDTFAKRYPSQEHSPMAGSPWALTQRFNNRREYFPNVVRPRAPTLPRF